LNIVNLVGFSLTGSAIAENGGGGVSACVGPGVGIPLGRHFMLSAEGIASFGTARWEKLPVSSATSRTFDPSILAGTINLNYVWGTARRATSPGEPAIGDSLPQTAGANAKPSHSTAHKVLVFTAKGVLAEGLIALNAAIAAGAPLPYGVVFVLLAPVAAMDPRPSSKAERVVAVAGLGSIGAYNLIMSGGHHTEQTIFNGNMIAWNVFLVSGWASRKLGPGKDAAPHGGGSGGTKGWSSEVGMVGPGPGLRVAYRF
jgi:hypothetical protein